MVCMVGMDARHCLNKESEKGRPVVLGEKSSARSGRGGAPSAGRRTPLQRTLRPLTTLAWVFATRVDKDIPMGAFEMAGLRNGVDLLSVSNIRPKRK